MSRTDYIYSDKLSLELFREGKRPVEVDEVVQGLLFINTKPTGSTKLAIRPKTGTFVIGDQDHQNPTAKINEKTNYFLFCDNIAPATPVIQCDATITTTNKASLSGNFMLEKYGIVDERQQSVESILYDIEKDPNLVVLYDHDPIPGYYEQTIISPGIILGASDCFYIELDGVHINSRGENLIQALLNYGDGKRLIVEAQEPATMEELITRQYLTITNRDSETHTLYIRYTGTDNSAIQEGYLSGILSSSISIGYQMDPDNLGMKVTFAPLHKAVVTMLPWYQYSVGGDGVMGNRYVIEVNGVAYRDTRPVSEINYPTASLASVVELNPALNALMYVTSGGDYNQIINRSKKVLNVKIYLDETVPYYQNNKTVDTGDNPTGIYKKLRYPYGTRLTTGTIRNNYTYHDSVYINVTNAGISFKLGPYGDMPNVNE